MPFELTPVSNDDQAQGGYSLTPVDDQQSGYSLTPVDDKRPDDPRAAVMAAISHGQYDMDTARNDPDLLDAIHTYYHEVDGKNFENDPDAAIDEWQSNQRWVDSNTVGAGYRLNKIYNGHLSDDAKQALAVMTDRWQRIPGGLSRIAHGDIAGGAEAIGANMWRGIADPTIIAGGKIAGMLGTGAVSKILIGGALDAGIGTAQNVVQQESNIGIGLQDPGIDWGEAATAGALNAGISGVGHVTHLIGGGAADPMEAAAAAKRMFPDAGTPVNPALNPIAAESAVQGAGPDLIQQVGSILKKNVSNPTAVAWKDGDRAGEIMFDNLTPNFTGNEDVTNVMQQVIEANGGFQDARRNTQSWNQLVSNTNQYLLKTYGIAEHQAMNRATGTAWNSEQKVAAAAILDFKSQEAADISRQIADTTAAGGMPTDAMYLSLKVKMDEVSTVTANLMGAVSESGRALNAVKMLQGLPAVMRGKAIHDLGKQLNMDTMSKVVTAVNSLNTRQQIGAFMTNMQKPAFKHMFWEAWYSGLLSGFGTQMANVAGNVGVVLNSVAETFIAGGISKLRGSEGGVFMSEGIGRLHGYISSIPEGVQAMIKAFNTENSTDLFTKLNGNKLKAIPSLKIERDHATGSWSFGMAKGGENSNIIESALGNTDGGKTRLMFGGNTIRIPSRALVAADDFFKVINYRASLKQQAYRDAAMNGKRFGTDAFANHVDGFLSNQSDSKWQIAHQNALQDARINTFTDDPGDLVDAVQRAVNAHPMLKLVVPFTAVPANIFQYAWNRLPGLSLINNKTKAMMAAEGAAGTDKMLAQATMGSMIVMGGFALAAQGRLTGGAPADPAERREFQERKQEYSYLVGGKNPYWLSFNRFDPFAMILGASADLHDFWTRAHDENEKKGALELLSHAIMNNVGNKTWLQGIGNIFQAISGTDSRMDQVTNGIARTMIPTIAANYGHAVDSTLRSAQTGMDVLRDRSIFQSDRMKVPPKVKMFGGYETSDAPLDFLGIGAASKALLGERTGDIIQRMYSPFYVKNAVKDPVLDYAAMVGYSKAPDKTLEGTKLDPWQEFTYQDFVERRTREVVDALFQAHDPSRLIAEGQTGAAQVRRLYDIAYARAHGEGRVFMAHIYPQLGIDLGQTRIDKRTGRKITIKDDSADLSDGSDDTE